MGTLRAAEIVGIGRPTLSSIAAGVAVRRGSIALAIAWYAHTHSTPQRGGPDAA